MNELDMNGFLDEHIGLVREEIMLRQARWEEAAVFLNACVMKHWIDWMPVDPVEERMSWVNGLMAKAITSYQGAIHLARLGMLPESITLTRTTLECAAWLGYFKEEPSAALLHFNGDEELSRSGRMKSYAASVSAIPDGWLNEAKKIAESAKKKSMADIFTEAKLEPRYYAFYKHFSGVADHPSNSAIFPHLLPNSLGSSRFGPEVDKAERAYFWAIQAMSVAGHTYSGISGTKVSDEDVLTLEAHWQTLIVRVREEGFSSSD